MAGTIGKAAAKKVLGRQIENVKVSGDTDPYFVTIKLPNGKHRKFKKHIPAYIPKHDAEILRKCKKSAHRLDIGYSVCGMKVGLKTIYGLIPELGDVLDLLLAEKLIRRCKKIDGGIPNSMQTKMRVYAVAAFAIGLAPYVGEFIDNFLRYNLRNVAMLEDYLKMKYGPEDAFLRSLSGLEDCGDSDARAWLAQYPDRDRPRAGVVHLEKDLHHGHNRFDDRGPTEHTDIAVASGNEKMEVSPPRTSTRKARRS